MKHEEFEHASLVEDWLKEPIGLPEIDTDRTAQLVHLTPQQHGWLRPFISRRSHTMFSFMKVAAAGVIVLAFGGFLVSAGLLSPQERAVTPAAVTAAPSASTSASPSEPAIDARPTIEADPQPLTTPPDDALIMGAGNGGDIGGWTEIGRVDTNADAGITHGEMQRLQSVGDRLVTVGSTTSPNEGPIVDVIYHSVDGVNWVPTTVPGNEPMIADLASTADGLIAAGSYTVDGAREARIWTSTDGVEWTGTAAPPELNRINQIVSAEAPLAVRGGEDLWVLDDDAEWTSGGQIIDSTILKGPGGFLTWQLKDAVSIIRSTDLQSGLSEVGLPNRLSKGGNALVRDTQIFATDDLWVLVPHVLNYPDTIFTSPDGMEWTEVPRPPGIIAGAVRWAADIDGQIQIFGAADGADGGLWTFVPGEPVAEAEPMTDNDAFINAPVAFGDGYAATGLKMGKNQRLTSWLRTDLSES